MLMLTPMLVAVLQKEGPAPGNYNYLAPHAPHPMSSSFKSKTPRFSTSHTVRMFPYFSHGTYVSLLLYFSHSAYVVLLRQHFSTSHIVRTPTKLSEQTRPWDTP